MPRDRRRVNEMTRQREVERVRATGARFGVIVRCTLKIVLVQRFASGREQQRRLPDDL